MKKHSDSVKKCEPSTKRMKVRASERRDAREVMAELVAQLAEQLGMRKARRLPNQKRVCEVQNVRT